MFFDPEIRNGPKTLEDYLSCNHARIVFPSIEYTPIDQHVLSIGKQSRVSVQVPNCTGLSSLMRGTDFISFLPSSLTNSIMENFATSSSPLPIDRLKI